MPESTLSKSTASKSAWRAGIAIAVLVLASAALMTFLYFSYREKHIEEERQRIINSGVFHKGISVAGIDVSGLTPDEARAALRVAEQQLIADVGFTLAYEGSTWQLGPDSFQITYNTEDVLKEAMALGRVGTLDELQAELADIETNGRSYTLSYSIALGDLSGTLQSIADALYVAPVNATFSVRQLEINDHTNAANAIDIGVAKDDNTTDIRDLRFDFIEASEGRELDKEALLSALSERTASREYGTIQLSVKPSYAAITVATLKGGLVLRSKAETFYGKTPYNRDTRVFNLKKATGIIYGTIVQPGEVFSTNTILGNRTEKAGWKLAPAVIEGGANTEDQAGGGVCQVSTTLYNAVLRADLEVVYRQCHSQKLSYVAGGLDATIDSGRIDFVWKNNTEAPIYVFTWIDTVQKYVRCEIYGLPFPASFDEIVLTSKDMGAIEPGPDEFIQTASLTNPFWMLKNASRRGSVWNSYAIYKKGGVEVERRFIAESKYAMHPNRYWVWVGYAGEPLNPAYQLTPVVP